MAVHCSGSPCTASTTSFSPERFEALRRREGLLLMNGMGVERSSPAHTVPEEFFESDF